MFKKSKLLLTTILFATLFAQTQSFATDNTTTVRDHRTTTDVTVRDHRTTPKTTVRDHRTKATVRDHRTTRKNEVVKVRKNEVVKISRKDCRVGYEELRRTGYDHVVMYKCTGNKYKYLAKKNASLFHADMNAYSGSMNIRLVGIVNSN